MSHRNSSKIIGVRDLSEHTVKIVVLGDSQVGKTSILRRLVYNTFSEECEPTVCMDFLSKTVQHGSQKLSLNFWDTSGEERFTVLLPTYVRDAAAAIIVYDVTNWGSFMSVPSWVQLVRDESPDEFIPIYVLGAKADDAHGREVSTREGCLMAVALGVRFAETSALSGHNFSAESFTGPQHKRNFSLKRFAMNIVRRFGLA